MIGRSAIYPEQNGWHRSPRRSALRNRQRRGIFEDSKTFADSVPLADPEEIERRFEARRDDHEFDLRTFVENHFRIPGDVGLDDPPGAGSVETHVQTLWSHLVEDPTAIGLAADQGTLVGVPEPYATPGGRFRELYYWDSYFTAEGLAASGELEQVENLIENFA